MACVQDELGPRLATGQTQHAKSGLEADVPAEETAGGQVCGDEQYSQIHEGALRDLMLEHVCKMAQVYTRSLYVAKRR